MNISVEIFSLAVNQLTGTIRDAYTNFMDLDSIDLSDNQFTGPIPSGLFNLPQIRFIDFHGNELDGRIPDNIGTAQLLESLMLHGNSLTGPVPSINPGELSNLKEFMVQDNRLTGSMAQEVCELRVVGFGVLETLWVDCGDTADPRIECESPECCTMCFPVQLDRVDTSGLRGSN
jgi:hypothetical protein